MIEVKFSKYKDHGQGRNVHEILISGRLLMHEDYPDPFINDEEVKQRLLAALSKELTGGIRNSLRDILTGLCEIRGCTEEHDTALAVTKLELHAVIQLLNSGMHLLRIDKMLGGSGH